MGSLSSCPGAYNTGGFYAFLQFTRAARGAYYSTLCFLATEGFECVWRVVFEQFKKEWLFAGWRGEEAAHSFFVQTCAFFHF